MMNDPIPNLAAFDDAALDQAFAAVERQAREDASTLDGEAFRLKWLGRVQGLLKEVSDRWLVAAPGPAKKAVGQGFKILKEFKLESAGAERFRRWPDRCSALKAEAAEYHSSRYAAALLESRNIPSRAR